MADVLAQEKALNELILAGKGMDGFEQFYADDIVMQENLDEPTRGKDKNRKREQDFMGMVEAFHGVKLLGSAVNGDVSYSEWEFDLTFKGQPRRPLTEVAARRWKDGKIVHERFYYKM